MLMMSVHHRELPYMVTTASPLDKATLSKLKLVLKSFLSQGPVLKLKVKTVLSIMDRMVAYIGEKYGYKSKIQKLSRFIREIF